MTTPAPVNAMQHPEPAASSETAPQAQHPAHRDGHDLRPHVVIVGAGFAGLYTAKALRSAPVRITVIDRRNFHLFQPLLYQVAAGGLSPGDIAAPIRAEFTGYPDVTTLQGEVVDLDPEIRRVELADGEEIDYDMLVVATGVRHHYFGKPEWERHAPGLKTLEDALDMRRRIFTAFEEAEREPDPDIRAQWLTFVVVGGGPTGVELAGTLAELAHRTLIDDFRRARPSDARILLVEGTDRVLPPFEPESGAYAGEALKELGVTVLAGTQVTDVREDGVTLKRPDGTQENVAARTVLWGAGVQASPLGRLIAERTGTRVDRIGRLVVDPDLTVPGYPEILVLGDMAGVLDGDGNPVPGVAPAAIQMGQFAARSIRRRLKGRNPGVFRYWNKGNLAVIGRNRAVLEAGPIRLKGFIAWAAWALIHIVYLIQFENRVSVMLRWVVEYATRKRGARLITGEGFEHGAGKVPARRTPAPGAQPAAPTRETRETAPAGGSASTWGAWRGR